jgi:hypothetical protein
MKNPWAAILAAVSLGAAGAAAWGGEEPKPVSPFAPNVQAPPRTDARLGAVTLSDGQVVKGLVMFTRGRKLEIFEDAAKKWHAFEMAQLSRLDTEVEEEKEEREWRWKEGGSDVKVYTGRTYIDRKYLTRLTLADWKTRVAGHVRGTVFFVQPTGGDPMRFFLRHDERGEYNQKSAEIVYPRSVVLEAGAPGEAKGEPGAAKGSEPENREKKAPPPPENAPADKNGPHAKEE